jgi:Flp pilus assembly protein TadG
MIRQRGERGAALLEFALSATVLVGLFAGAFQIGHTFYAYNRLEGSVRRGAQYASLKPHATIEIQNMVVYGNPNPPAGAAPVLNGLTTSNVRVTVTGAADAPAFVTVSINGYRINSVFSTTMLNGRPSVTFPYLAPRTVVSGNRQFRSNVPSATTSPVRTSVTAQSPTRG